MDSTPIYSILHVRGQLDRYNQVQSIPEAAVSSRWQYCVSVEDLPVIEDKFPQHWAPLSWLFCTLFPKHWLCHSSGYDSSHFTCMILSKNVFILTFAVHLLSLDSRHDSVAWPQSGGATYFFAFLWLWKGSTDTSSFPVISHLSSLQYCLTYWYIRSGFYSAFRAGPVLSVNWIFSITNLRSKLDLRGIYNIRANYVYMNEKVKNGKQLSFIQSYPDFSREICVHTV